MLALGAATIVGSVAAILLPTSSSSPARQVVNVLIDSTFILFIAAGLVWRRPTRRFRRALNDDEGARRFAVAWAIAVGVFVVADCAMRRPRPDHRLQVLGAGARILWTVLALIVVVTMHRDMRRVLAGVPRITPVARAPIQYDTVATTDLAPAGQAFWQAAAAARRAGRFR